MHYFASYEYEREPGTIFAQPVGAARPELHDSVQEQPAEHPGARRRSAVAATIGFTVRGSRWDWENPFVLGAGGHPSNASVQTKNATNILRHLVASVLSEQQGPGSPRSATTTSQWTNEPQDARSGHASSTDFAGPDHRQAVQLPAAVLPEQLRDRATT